MIPYVLTKDEVNGWLSYFIHKKPDVNEIQMAILISSVRNAINSKAKAKVEDFLITKKRTDRAIKKESINKSAEVEGEKMIQIGKYMPIKETDLSKYLKNPSK